MRILGAILIFSFVVAGGVYLRPYLPIFLATVTKSLPGEISLGESPESVALRSTLSSFNGKERQVFCGTLRLEFEAGEMFIDSNKRLILNRLTEIANGGYLAEDKTPRPLTYQNFTKQEYKFIPGPRFSLLELRRDGNCFFSAAASARDIKIVAEEKHPQYSDITVVSATYVREGGSEWEKLISGSKSSNRKVRGLAVRDPFQDNKVLMKRLDYGDRDGAFASDNVPNAIAEINTTGPHNIRGR